MISSDEPSAFDLEDGWTCPVCRGTRTIQPDPCTPPEPCYCVDEDEECDDPLLTSSDLEEPQPSMVGRREFHRDEPSHPRLGGGPAGGTAAALSQCDDISRHTDATNERK